MGQRRPSGESSSKSGKQPMYQKRATFITGDSPGREWHRDDSPYSPERDERMYSPQQQQQHYRFSPPAHHPHYPPSADSRASPYARSPQNDSMLLNGTHFSDDAGLDGEVAVDPATPPLAYWSSKRHTSCGNPTPPPPWSAKTIPWRGNGAPGRLKTANAALVLCLNIDVDPPDVVKTNPCAVLEAWVDPHTMPSQKAMEVIAANLKLQFEGLSLKLMYKAVQDPSYDDLWRTCQTLRKQAKEDAVLFHYNGHGVPKPTASGELWCFNRDYTQYIPVSLNEIQSWLGSPAIYIWDCSAAGHLLSNFNTFAERRDLDARVMHGGPLDGSQPFTHSLQLAACAAYEQLPSCPELPADLFTSCLTSPIDMALRYFIMHHQLPSNITADMVMQLPGDLKDRKTPLGELNWIFTAITDTIAWTTFSRETFTKLYRCDLLIASLFRNFLLAERIMKNYQCTPHTEPPLPPTNTHPLWATWDLAVDACLRQLPDLLSKRDSNTVVLDSTVTVTSRPGRIGQNSKATADKGYNYTPSRFFADQLTAFEVWISRGGAALTKRGPMSLPASAELDENVNPLSETEPVKESHLVPRKPPDQLPIVLQVLLCQPHRLRALILLSQFVDLGPWAVHLVLTIGIFPYISKLLQAAGPDLRPVLIFIWARILAVDPSVQVDLVNSTGYKYFSNILGARDEPSFKNVSEHKAMCAFILASAARDYRPGQDACVSARVLNFCFEKLDEPDFLLRQWSALCIAQLWESHDEHRAGAVQQDMTTKFIQLLSDDSVEVRCASLYALGTFMGASGSSNPDKRGGGASGRMAIFESKIDHFKSEVALVTGITLAVKDDASPMCRKEMIVVLSCLVKEYRGYFVVCAWIYYEEDRHRMEGKLSTVTDEAVKDWLAQFPVSEQNEKRVYLSSFFTLFVILLDLSVDPYHEVATNAQTVLDYIIALLLDSPFARISPSIHFPLAFSGSRKRTNSHASTVSGSPMVPPLSPVPRPALSRADTMTSTISNGVTNTLRRTSSFASALKSLVAFPSSEETLHEPVEPPPPGAVSRPPSPTLNLAKYASPYAEGYAPADQNWSAPPSPRFSDAASDVTFHAWNVIEALVEEDMERLRARRRTGPGRRGHSHGGPGASPSSSFSSMDSTASSVILGLGTGTGMADVLPLKSTYFDWCTEYFTEPQMRQAEADEPGSIQYNYQMWRLSRNDLLIDQTRRHIDVAETSKWNKVVRSLPVSGHPTTIKFHSYDKHLFVADSTDVVSIWDWSQKDRSHICSFSNGDPAGVRITALDIINQDMGGIILTGSSDGMIRLYRNYDPTVDQGPVQMVSAFRGLSDVVPVHNGAGLAMNWKQSTGILLAGGDSRIIKVWDAQTETPVLDLETASGSPVTSIACEQAPTMQAFLAGFGNGEVKLFDPRLEEDACVVATFNEHESWVQNIRPYAGSPMQFLSASLDGKVKLWDLRNFSQSLPLPRLSSFTQEIHADGLAAFDAHSTARVYASTSAVMPWSWKTQRLTVFNAEQELSSMQIPTGLAGPPPRNLITSRLCGLVFHPLEMVCAVSGPEGNVRVIGCNFEKV
ncbi:unnamed protein product [Mycena citricolor]|uniref:Raptor N-terminal CASPase-like domain-containing protein n=1 Tax=Mycena citricolor TaxID=2018698 RepID=A0AAD2HU46_9AGAR|nr:unnamed protein product [Mycena citricolor]